MNRFFFAALILVSTATQAKDFIKPVERQPARQRHESVTQVEAIPARVAVSQTELMQRQFPEGTTCHFKLSREQLMAMKPSELYIPAGNVVYCRQPFDSIPESRPLQL